MGTQLSPDDLSPNQIVTVLDGPMRLMSQSASSIDTIEHWQPDKSMEGMPLRIIAVSLPFVLVEVIGFNSRRIIDVRESTLGRVDPSYVQAFMPQMPGAMQQQQAYGQQPSNQVEGTFVYPWSKFRKG